MIHSAFLRYAWLSLGVVFVLAGLGKVVLFVPFADTIAGVIHTRGVGPGLIAGFVVLLEFVGGISLMARYKTVLGGSLLFCAVSILLWVLSSAMAQGREIQCHCFGLLNFQLANREEMALEVVFLNLIALVIFLTAWRRKARSGSDSVITVTIILLFLFVEFAAFGAFFADNTKATALDSLPAVFFAENQSTAFANFRKGNRLLFLVDFSDFNCPPCFDDFMILNDAVREHFASSDSLRCFLLFRRGELANPEHPERLYQWLRASGLTLPAGIGSDSLFEKLRFTKSCVAVISPSGRTLFREIFPLGPENHEIVLSLLRDSHVPSP